MQDIVGGTRLLAGWKMPNRSEKGRGARVALLAHPRYIRTHNRSLKGTLC
jgi:hypothetical protein